LRDPDLLELIWGKGKDHEKAVKEMVEAWTKARDDLYAKARRILLGDSSTFNDRKTEFVAALQRFAKSTEKMNREYTSRAMEILRIRIKKRLDAPSKSSTRREPLIKA